MPDLTLDWGAFGPFGTNVSGNETVDTGGVNVSVGFTAQDEDASAVTINAPGYVGPDEPFDDQSFLKLVGDGGEGGVDDTSTTTIDFSSSDDLYADEVQNVEFRLNDIDGGGDDIDPGTPDHQDIVTVRAYDAEGNEVPVSYSSGSAVDEAGNTLTGGDTNFDFQDGGASTLVSIAGPVSRIEIEYENGDIGEQAVMVSDVHFETIDASDNLAPTAAPDNASTDEDTAVIVDVTSNDTDPEGDDLTVSGVSDPANGSATVNTDGTVTYTPDTGFVGSDSFDYTIEDEAGNTSTSTVSVSVENVVPCFTPGTAIATPRGERLVEDLKVGDKIITRDNGIQEIRWIGQRQMSGHELARAPHLRPILIQKGSLGHNLPEHDILVSPQHRLLINNDRTSLYFEETEVLAAAKHLTDLKGVDEVGTLGVTYVHFMFDNHEVVLSNGAWTESFQPGQTVIDGLGTEQRQEIFELFPELETEDGVKDYAAARRSLKKHEAKLLVR